MTEEGHGGPAASTEVSAEASSGASEQATGSSVMTVPETDVESGAPQSGTPPEPLNENYVGESDATPATQPEPELEATVEPPPLVKPTSSRKPLSVDTTTPADPHLRRKSVFDQMASPTHGLRLLQNEDAAIDPYDEHLGEDFLKYPWKIPNKALARADVQKARFVKGHASFTHTFTADLTDLGEGVKLYFVWLKYMLWFTLLASLLSIPHLMMSFYGEGFYFDDLDPMKTGTLTAGNHRFINNTETSSPTMFYCTANNLTTVHTMTGEDVSCDEWFFRLAEGDAGLLTAAHGSYLVTICDLAICFIFAIMWLLFSYHLRKVEAKGSFTSVKPKHYTVYVTGLPDNAEDEDVIKHFSELYRLDQPSWSTKGRLCGLFGSKKSDPVGKLRDSAGRPIYPQPVSETDQSPFDHLCLGSWLAECAVIHPEGKFIKQTAKLQKSYKDSIDQRAIIKKYRPLTTNPKGPNKRKRSAAEKKLVKLNHSIMTGKQAMKDHAEELGKNSERVIGAYIIFNYEESFIRCIRDYSPYSSAMWRDMQPEPLRFGPNKIPIKVEKAPMPGNIVWENLEVSKKNRRVRFAITFVLTFILLLLIFAVIAWSRRTTNLYSEQTVDTLACYSTIPTSLNATEGSVYTTYNPENPSGEAIPGDFSTCPPSEQWVWVEGAQPPVPDGSGSCSDPCMNLESPTFFNVNTCQTGSFSQADMVACYCQQEITDLVKQNGPLGGAYKAVEELDPMCFGIVKMFLKSESLLILATVTVSVGNLILKFALDKLIDFESHNSVTEKALSITSKMTFVLFVNTVFVIILVNVFIDSSDKLFGNKDGSKDFTYHWYATAGTALCLTIINNVIVSQIDLLYGYFVKRPLWTTFGSFFSQLHMNRAFQGPAFRLENRVPFTLALVAIAMVFGSALPLLYPVAFMGIAITIFWERIMLVHYFQRPQPYDQTIAAWANMWMPTLLFLHCAFTVWIFSNLSIFDSHYIFEDIYRGDDLQKYLDYLDQIDQWGVLKRILLINTFPFFLIVLLFVVCVFVNYTFGVAFSLVWKMLTCRCLRGGEVLEIKRLSNPPYTETFTRTFRANQVPHNIVELCEESKLEVAKYEHVRCGDFDWWVLEEDPRHKDFVTLKRKHTEPAARWGEDMRTWEAMKDSGITHTYHIEDNDEYAHVISLRNKLVTEIVNEDPEKAATVYHLPTPKSPGGKLWPKPGFSPPGSSRQRQRGQRPPSPQTATPEMSPPVQSAGNFVVSSASGASEVSTAGLVAAAAGAGLVIGVVGMAVSMSENNTDSVVEETVPAQVDSDPQVKEEGVSVDAEATSDGAVTEGAGDAPATVSEVVAVTDDVVTSENTEVVAESGADAITTADTPAKVDASVEVVEEPVVDKVETSVVVVEETQSSTEAPTSPAETPAEVSMEVLPAANTTIELEPARVEEVSVSVAAETNTDVVDVSVSEQPSEMPSSEDLTSSMLFGEGGENAGGSDY